MKHPIAVSMAGLMLMTSWYENVGGKMPFNLFASNLQSGGSKPVTPEDVGEKNLHHEWQGKSAPSLYDGGFFARIDFLYWRADEEGLQYGAERTEHLPKVSSKIVSPSVKWGPGFRVGLGYTFAQQDYWDLMVLWTHFQTQQSSSFNNHGISSKFFLPSWESELGSTAGSASAHWRLNYNIYDLDLGRNYFVAKTFSVHPFIGLRGATIHQYYRANYQGIFDALVIPTSFKANNDFWGLGAHVGTGLQWRCTDSFALIGQAGGSLLYADFRVKQSTVGVVDFVGTINYKTFEQHPTTLATNLEAMLGVQWERFFYQNTWRLALTLGYEWSEWFSQNQLTRINSYVSPTDANTPSTLFDGAKGNLALQGLTFQARLDF